MKIQIRNNFKSIPAGIEFEIPSFTVLTGENGSGKTHLFEAIKDNNNGYVVIDNKQLKQINYIGFGALNPAIDR